MPNSAHIERGAIMLAHMSEEVFAYLLRLTGATSTQIIELATEAAAALFDPNIAPVIHVAVVCDYDVALDGSDPDYDGQTLVPGELLALINMPPATGHDFSPTNGVYEIQADGSLARYGSDARQMRMVHAMRGTYAGCLFEMRTDDPIVLGTTDIEFGRIKADPFGTVRILAGDDEVLETNELHFLGADGLSVTKEQPVGNGPMTFTIGKMRSKARVVITTNVTLSGIPTTGVADDISLFAGDEVLLVGQTTASENGLQVIDSGAWARPTGWAPSPTSEVKIDAGTVFAGTVWRLDNTSSPVVGTDAQTWRRSDHKRVVISTNASITLSKHTWPGVDIRVTGLPPATGITITLPAAADYKGGRVTIKDVSGLCSGTRFIRAARSGTDTIEAATQKDILAAYGWMNLMGNTNWWII